MRLHTVAATWAIVSTLFGAASLVAQQRPLPDQASFLLETRKHLRTDSALQSSYVYVETRKEQKLDSAGRVQEESTKVFESYPGLPGEERWERLMSENGRPRAAAALQKDLDDRQKRAQALVKETVEQPARQQARQQRDYQKNQREFDAVLDDLFLVYDIRMEGRESVDGHDTIVFMLTPRPAAKPRTREGGQMRSFKVKAWVSESDHELVRVEAEATDTLSMGLGLLARIHKGSQLSFLRRKINDEVWLPATVSYSGSARVGLVAVLRRRGTSDFSGYRKFSVDTSTTYEPGR